jgi:hypothetical protein
MAILKKRMTVVLVMFALLVSCTTNEIYEEYYNVNTFSRNYTVTANPNMWSVGDDDEAGAYFFHEVRIPELTQHIYDRGIMQAFIFLNDGNVSPLPFDDFWVNQQTGFMWTEQVTCEFRPGFVTFILKYSDRELYPPSYNTYRFNVRFQW